MSSQLVWKIYDAQGVFVAACTYSEDAAAVVNLHGQGATIRFNHGPILWRNGAEEFEAGESYDRTSNLLIERRSVYQHRKAQKAQS